MFLNMQRTRFQLNWGIMYLVLNCKYLESLRMGVKAIANARFFLIAGLSIKFKTYEFLELCRIAINLN